MKRDLELIRSILETVEATDFTPGQNIDVKSYDFKTVAFHVELLKEAGYVVATIGKTDSGEYTHVWPRRLTWEGYEFLDLSRSETVWQKSKKILKDKSISVSVAVLTELLKAIAKEAVGLSGVHLPQ
jgi:hypothetical protein